MLDESPRSVVPTHNKRMRFSQTREDQELIRLYYQWGPVSVKSMEEDKEFNTDVIELIDSVLPLIERVVD